MEESSLKQDLPQSDRNEVVLDAVSTLLKSAGHSDEKIELLVNALTRTEEIAAAKEDAGGYKTFKEKTLVYEDREAFIYKRPDRNTWYFRIYDPKNRKPLVKSLKTRDKTQALTTARTLYIDIKGKIERGEILKQITSPQLVEKWLEVLQKQVTPIPHQGITPDTYKAKRSFLRNWLQYVDKGLNMSHVPIDKIKPEVTRDFAKWLKSKPKETSLETGARSHEQINNNVSAVIRMYHQYAVREKYISADRVPQIDRVKYEVGDAFKRDIFTNLKQYDKYIWYLKRKYITKKHNPALCMGKKGARELEVRKIFTEFILILSNAGFRTKELLGMKFKEIYASPNWSKEQKDEWVVMVVRADNAKTGKERRVVTPCKKRIDRIIAAYKKIGITHEPEDYLFMNPLSPTRKQYGRMIMYQRLKKTLVASGVQEELDREGKRISPYSFRHYYAYLRLINKVSIHLLAKNMGTSVAKIESTYGHINTELHAEELTIGQGIIKRTETSLETLPTIEEDIY